MLRHIEFAYFGGLQETSSYWKTLPSFTAFRFTSLPAHIQLLEVIINPIRLFLLLNIQASCLFWHQVITNIMFFERSSLMESFALHNTWLWVKNRATPKWVILVNEKMD